MDAQNKIYPTLPRKTWWALRRKFRSSIPRELTPNYLSSALSVSVKTASNILPDIRLIGLVDEENKTGDLAVRWRDDEQYQQVCQSIRSKIYPQDLLDLAAPGDTDRTAIQSWFGNHPRIGESVASKMAGFYLMLCEADLSKQDDSIGQAAMTKSKAETVRKTNKPRIANQSEPALAEQDEERKVRPMTQNAIRSSMTDLQPQFNFNIQIVLPENASAQTYDDIFKSISKNLIGRNS